MTRIEQRGSVLLAVVLLVALMAAMVATYSRSALVSAHKSGGDSGRIETAVQSGIAYAEKSLEVGRTGNTVLVAPSGASVSVTLADAGSGRVSIDVNSSDGGATRQVTGVAEVYPLPSGTEVPTLSPDARTAVLTAPDLVTITTDDRVKDGVISGTWLVTNGARLSFENCIITGTVVTESAMYDDPVGMGIAQTRIHFLDSVIMRPNDVLPGCLIVAPYDEVKLLSQSRLESHGVIIADYFDADGTVGTWAILNDELISNQILNATQPTFLQLAAVNRGTQPLPSSLSSTGGSVGLSRVEFSHGGPTAAEKSAILGFDLVPYLAAGGVQNTHALPGP
jgi:hypothetical protein